MDPSLTYFSIFCFNQHNLHKSTNQVLTLEKLNLLILFNLMQLIDCGTAPVHLVHLIKSCLGFKSEFPSFIVACLTCLCPPSPVHGRNSSRGELLGLQEESLYVHASYQGGQEQQAECVAAHSEGSALSTPGQRQLVGPPGRVEDQGHEGGGTPWGAFQS